MKYYTICYPGEVGQLVKETFTEQQILASYWDYWSERMRDSSQPVEKVTEENCIIDWIVIHWATQTDQNGNKIQDLVDYYKYDIASIHKTSDGNLL